MNEPPNKHDIARAHLHQLHQPPSSPPQAPGAAGANSIVSAFTLPEIYYDIGTTYYWLRNKRDRFIKISKSDVAAHLSDAGLAAFVPKGMVLSEVDAAILRIQHEHDVEFVGAIAGRRKGLIAFGDTRVLVTTQATWLEPKEGDCSMLLGILERMFGPVQLPYLLAWLVVTLDMFRRGTWRPAQAMFVAGPPGAGKGLLATIFRYIFGGRTPGKPYRFMTGRVEFNSDFFGSEFLTIEDEAESVSIQARRAFGAAIKMMTVNEIQWLHAKGKPALSVVPLWRLFASLNNDLERLQVVPPIEDDIADKIMLLLAEKHPLPMPTETAEQFEIFMAALKAQLPAFIYHLNHWTIPVELRSSRFGVTHYHHPELLSGLQQLSPEDQLMDLVDEFIFSIVNTGKPWQGRSIVLDRELKDHKERRCAREAEKLLAHSTSCGKYLGRLEKRYPGRVSQRTVTGNTVWTILPPPGTVPASSGPKISNALMEQIKTPHAKAAADAGAGDADLSVR